MTLQIWVNIEKFRDVHLWYANKENVHSSVYMSIITLKGEKAKSLQVTTLPRPQEQGRGKKMLKMLKEEKPFLLIFQLQSPHLWPFLPNIF